MKERTLEKISQYLQQLDVRQRIRRDMLKIREEAIVTIGRAAKLFAFSENQLRDWEKIGLLKPARPNTDSRQSIADVNATLYRTLDTVLKLGMDDGGNVVYAWDPGIASFAPYRSDESRK